MDFKLAPAPEGGYAILTIHSEVSHATATGHQRAMLGFVNAYGIEKFLLDTRGHPFVGTVLDTYTFARDTLPEEGFDRTWKVAVVTSPADDSHGFLETVTFNAGYRVKIFRNYEQAVRWLKQKRVRVTF